MEAGHEYQFSVHHLFLPLTAHLTQKRINFLFVSAFTKGVLHCSKEIGSCTHRLTHLQGHKRQQKTCVCACVVVQCHFHCGDVIYEDSFGLQLEQWWQTDRSGGVNALLRLMETNGILCKVKEQLCHVGTLGSGRTISLLNFVRRHTDRHTHAAQRISRGCASMQLHHNGPFEPILIGFSMGLLSWAQVWGFALTQWALPK